MTEVRVNRRAAERVRSGHPWIFRSDLLQAGGAPAGRAVRVLDGRNNRLGTAHYSTRSQIALRMLPEQSAVTDAAFFQRYIQRAQTLRDVVVAETDAYRVVHAEADLLPGLVIDRYGDCFVIQTLSQGMEKAKDAVVGALGEIYTPLAVVERNDGAVRRKEGLDEISGVLSGEMPEEIEVSVNGLRFGVDALHGQKTGLYLDQRENYQAAHRYARGRALDCFTYQGAFALHLAGQCDHVDAVDSSAASLRQARRNGERNGLANVEFCGADVFDFLQQQAQSHRRFDTVVLDPPAFAKSRRHREGAGRAYKEINRRALQLLARDGILISCSCSFHFSEADLLTAVAEAALDTGRTLRVLERRTQGRDHPILLTVPETHYLKCLILQVV